MQLFQRKAIIAILAMGATATAAKAQDKNVLRIYFADVEGGQATLFVTPLHESLLVDTGWPGYDNRDADRILALCKKASVTKIDTVLITHFHADHAGGITQLAAKIAIGQFIDHGDNTETANAATLSAWKAYQQTLAEVHIPRVTAKPGDVLPLKGMKVEIVSGNGDLIDKPLSGGGAGRRNPVCVHSAMRYVENTENDRSLGMIITFGKLRIADLGDLTWAKERLLMCPVDKLGQVDVLVVSHHGMDRSSSPALVDALAPRVAIMDNGGHKGGSQPAWSVIEASPVSPRARAISGSSIPPRAVTPPTMWPMPGSQICPAPTPATPWSCSRTRTAVSQSPTKGLAKPSNIRLSDEVNKDRAATQQQDQFRPVATARLCILIRVR